VPGLRDLPEAKGDRHVRTFARFGWNHCRSNGSHKILEKPGVEAILSIPCGGKNVKRTLLYSQIKLAGLTVKEYVDAFK
jgi:predicted RNA binding protein YcfA (HicA-like mRNA interferase family)